MGHTFKDIQKAIAELIDFMGQVNGKDSTLSTRQSGSTPYGIVYKLKTCAPAFLTHPDALDLLIETAPAIEAYRGKGTKPFNDGLVEIFHCILIKYEYGSLTQDDSESSNPEKIKSSALQKTALFALLRARGDGKVLRSRRAAEIRKSYWNLLTDLSHYVQVPEVLQLAKNIAQNEKSTLPERSGAIGYLLTHLTILNDTDGGKSDPEIDSIIADLREAPPSREILFEVLDAGINSGEIDEMSALFDLEDWDEKNGSPRGRHDRFYGFLVTSPSLRGEATGVLKGFGSTQSSLARMMARGAARTAAGLFMMRRLKAAVVK
jgi:hypothetical protein